MVVPSGGTVSWPPGGSTASVPATGDRVGDGEGVGLARVGVGAGVRDGVGLGLALVGAGVGDAVTVGDAALVGLTVGLGDDARCVTAGVRGARLLPGAAATAAGALAAGADGLGPPATVPCPVLPVSSKAAAAMATATTTPATRAAWAAEGRRRPLPPTGCDPAGVACIGLGNPCRPNDPARPRTAARCATALGPRPTASPSVCALSPAGAPSASRKLTAAAAITAAPGDRPSSMAGRSSKARRALQTGQRSMCRCTRLRIGTVRCPSQSPSMPRSSRHSSRPARPTSSAPRHARSWSRARDSSECTWLRDTPSTVAISPGSSPCRSCSSMASRSAGFMPLAASSIRVRSSACSASSLTSTPSSVTSGASSSATVVFRARAARRHSLRATAYSQGRSSSGSRKPDSREAAMTNVSCTASAASAGSLSMDRQYLYSGSAYLSYASASPSGSPATMDATTSLSRM
jgi:hypothetical protein